MSSNFTLSIPLTKATIFLFRLVSTEPITDKKIFTETVNQLLPTTAPALESNVHDKGIAGHSPRYFRANTMFEVDVKSKLTC